MRGFYAITKNKNKKASGKGQKMDLVIGSVVLALVLGAALRDIIQGGSH